MKMDLFSCTDTIRTFKIGLCLEYKNKNIALMDLKTSLHIHRLLAVAVEADITYPELLDKKKTQEIANNINYR